MKRKMKPAHPGPQLYELLIAERDTSITDTAKELGVSRKQLSEVVNGIASITPEMALRIEKVFGSSAELWLKLQAKYDLWMADNSGKLDHLQPLPAKRTQKRAS